MTPCTIQLGGKPVVVRESSKPLKAHDGYCRPPADGQPGLIVISKGLSPSKQIETFLHEADHLQYWFVDEEIIELACREKNEALEQLGLI
jgi:hypothetical protein